MNYYNKAAMMPDFIIKHNPKFSRKFTNTNKGKNKSKNEDEKKEANAIVKVVPQRMLIVNRSHKSNIAYRTRVLPKSKTFLPPKIVLDEETSEYQFFKNFTYKDTEKPDGMDAI